MAAKRPKEEDRHTGRMLGVWMPLENHAALDLIAAKEYRSKSAIVMRSLAEYCQKRKHDWPAAERLADNEKDLRLSGKASTAPTSKLNSLPAKPGVKPGKISAKTGSRGGKVKLSATGKPDSDLAGKADSGKRKRN
jgi:hypothetical protein